MTRADDIHEFLTSTGWAKATRAPLAGDAGNRRYERLVDSANNKAVLMDADPAMGEDVRPFLKIAAHLISCGLAAPKIFAQNAEQGFILGHIARCQCLPHLFFVPDEVLQECRVGFFINVFGSGGLTLFCP